MRLFQIDAFADAPFTGNPAAVCLLGDAHRDDAWSARESFTQPFAGATNGAELRALLRERPGVVEIGDAFELGIRRHRPGL